MKKLVLIVVALITIQATAQDKKREHAPEDRKERSEHFKNMSPEDFATLQSKKMTLHLDLNDSQQKEIYKLNLTNATARKAAMEARKNTSKKPSKEKRLEMANARLDHKIVMKKKMKSILNDEQYAKWEKSQA